EGGRERGMEREGDGQMMMMRKRKRAMTCRKSEDANERELEKRCGKAGCSAPPTLSSPAEVWAGCNGGPPGSHHRSPAPHRHTQAGTDTRTHRHTHIPRPGRTDTHKRARTDTQAGTPGRQAGRQAGGRPATQT